MITLYQGTRKMASLLKKLLAKRNRSNQNSHLSQKASPNQSSPESAHDIKPFGKLVVVGNESIFSRPLIDYAVDMAQRMSYEIVALNTAPLSCETFKLFSSSRNKVCQDFQELSEQNVRAFKEEVRQLNIPFSHVVKFCDTDQAIEELQKEIGGIDFIVSDAQAEQDIEVAMDREAPRCQVFVYAMN